MVHLLLLTHLRVVRGFRGKGRWIRQITEYSCFLYEVAEKDINRPDELFIRACCCPRRFFLFFFFELGGFGRMG